MNMNFLLIGILVVAALPFLLSTLGGLVKGAKRAILRLILVVASFFVVFLLRDKVTGFLLEKELIEGQTLVDFIASKLPEDFKNMTDLVVPLLTGVVSVVVFFVAYLAMLIVSWILFLLLKIFVKKGFGKKQKKFGLIGLLVGAVQGAFIAVTLATPLVGLISDLAPVQDVQYGETNLAEMIPENISLKEFADNKYVQMDLQYVGSFYDKLSTITYKEKEYTIGGQVEALSAAVKVANELSSIMDIDFSGGLSEDSAEDIQNIFNKLDSLFGEDGELSEEAVETVNNMISSVAEQFDLPVDISGIYLGEIDFAKEGEVVVNLMKYADTDSTEEIVVADVINDLAESTLILSVLESTEVTVDLDEGQKLEAEEAINNLPEGTPAETVATLRALLGLTD